MTHYNNALTQDVLTTRYTATYEVHNGESFDVVVTAKNEEEAIAQLATSMRFDPRLIMVDYTMTLTELKLVDALYSTYSL